MAATIRMEKAALWGLAKAHRRIQCPDRQVFLHTVAGRSTDNAATVQVEDNGKVEPTLCSPDISYIAGRFTVP